MVSLKRLWYLHLGKRHIRHRDVKCSSLCSQNVFRMSLQDWRRCSLNTSNKKLGITCSITAAMWLLSRFLNEWIWKKTATACKNLRKRKTFHIWKRHVTPTDKGINLFLWGCHVMMSRKEAYKSNSFKFENTFSHFKVVRLLAQLDDAAGAATTKW